MHSQLLPKYVWKCAVGASKKPRQLHLVADSDGLFNCPVSHCDSTPYESKRGCRKHVFQRHGWYYYFEENPNIEEVLPEHNIKRNRITTTQRSNTHEMLTFEKSSLSTENLGSG